MPLQSPQTRSALYVPQPTSISQITELNRGATIQATTLNRGATIQTTALKWRGYFSAFTCTKLNQFQINSRQIYMKLYSITFASQTPLC